MTQPCSAQNRCRAKIRSWKDLPGRNVAASKAGWRQAGLAASLIGMGAIGLEDQAAHYTHSRSGVTFAGPAARYRRRRCEYHAFAKLIAYHTSTIDVKILIHVPLADFR